MHLILVSLCQSRSLRRYSCEIIAKMLTFAVLTLIAGGLLIRMAWAARARSPNERRLRLG